MPNKVRWIDSDLLVRLSTKPEANTAFATVTEISDRNLWRNPPRLRSASQWINACGDAAGGVDEAIPLR